MAETRLTTAGVFLRRALLSAVAAVPVEMPDNIVRIDDFERKAVMSSLGELALDRAISKAAIAAYDASDLGVSDSAG